MLVRQKKKLEQQKQLKPAGLIPEIKASNASKLTEAELKEIKNRAHERRLELFHQCYEQLLAKIKQAAETGVIIHHKKGIS